MIKINEIFYSIQGESSVSGLPCVFIRLTYCNLRCSYCDTEYAFYEGTDMSIDDIMNNIKKYKCKLVEVTGGEPLMQEESIDLMKTSEGFKAIELNISEIATKHTWLVRPNQTAMNFSRGILNLWQDYFSVQIPLQENETRIRKTAQIKGTT